MLCWEKSSTFCAKSIDIDPLSEKTGINYESLKNKMSGATEFKRNEMVSIKQEFPTCTLDYLFSTTDES